MSLKALIRKFTGKGGALNRATSARTSALQKWAYATTRES